MIKQRPRPATGMCLDDRATEALRHVGPHGGYRDGMRLMGWADGESYVFRYEAGMMTSSDMSPDLADSLTRRGLLDVIREVTGEPLLYVAPTEHAPGDVNWAVIPPKRVTAANLWVRDALHGTWGATEAKALVNALEALAAALADRTSDGSAGAEGVAQTTEPEITKETP